MDTQHTGIGEVFLWLGAMCLAAFIGVALSLVLVIVPTDKPGSSMVDSLLERFNTEPAFAPFRSSELEGGEPSIFSIAVQQPPEMRFIVRFDPEAKLLNAVRSFRENRGQGRAMFSEWTSQETVFTGFNLAGVLPSGEAILAYQPSATETASLAQLRRRLNDVEYVVYADTL
ncbi:MAG: hypothetical protein CMK09_08285 [Ponticaulis sp.]|nr:hypothetical protein [Ponticaulis sp.]|tara:strand:- start:8461 stop:8976 length:516 start_codon:yes stop_codon:yes gene_type:complete